MNIEEMPNKELFDDTTKQLKELFEIAEKENRIPEAIEFTKIVIETLKASQLAVKSISDGKVLK